MIQVSCLTLVISKKTKKTRTMKNLITKMRNTKSPITLTLKNRDRYETLIEKGAYINKKNVEMTSRIVIDIILTFS